MPNRRSLKRKGSLEKRKEKEELKEEKEEGEGGESEKRKGEGGEREKRKGEVGKKKTMERSRKIQSRKRKATEDDHFASVKHYRTRRRRGSTRKGGEDEG